MTSSVLNPDLCIIGAGSGGLSLAAGASQMGADVVLIERDRMGGDCLNTGCVPSKSLLAAAHVAHQARHGETFGVTATPQVDFARSQAHVQEVIAGIEPHDSQERFESLGVTVLRDHARFVDVDTVEAEGKQIKARRFIIATGSRAFVPPIPGLQDVAYMTNETIFENTVLPEHLLIIGGGPIGVEMAQAHRRLGAKVTIVDQSTIMPKDDQDCVAIVRKALIDEGVELIERTQVQKLESVDGQIILHHEKDGQADKLTGSHLLVAAGRRANIEDLNLEAAGIKTTKRGIDVHANLRSVSNKRVYAMGDVAGGLQFTHLAGDHAGTLIRQLLFRLPAKAKADNVPWVTYADPELAHVGLNEAMAKAQGLKHQVLSLSFDSNDRARSEKRTEGLIKVVVQPNGRILGASIVGVHAGELLHVWVVAISNGLKIGKIAQMVAPYPTLGEINKRVAGSYYTPKLFSDRTRWIVRFLARFG